MIDCGITPDSDPTRVQPHRAERLGPGGIRRIPYFCLGAARLSQGRWHVGVHANLERPRCCHHSMLGGRCSSGPRVSSAGDWVGPYRRRRGVAECCGRDGGASPRSWHSNTRRGRGRGRTRPSPWLLYPLCRGPRPHHAKWVELLTAVARSEVALERSQWQCIDDGLRLWSAMPSERDLLPNRFADDLTRSPELPEA